MSHFYLCADNCYQNCKVIVTKKIKVKLSSYKWMKNDLTTGARQHNIGCPIKIVLVSTSDEVNLTSGNVETLSLNITQSYQPNSHMWLMMAVLPVSMVSGTSPLVIYTLLLVDEWINASSSIQWSQSTLGEPVLIILWDAPCFSSEIQPSAACCHGE